MVGYPDTELLTEVPIWETEAPNPSAQITPVKRRSRHWSGSVGDGEGDPPLS